ncbi:MAG TPA: thiamine phosphate synthase [Dongiaceae bacterium]
MSESHHCRLFIRLPAGPGFDDALQRALSDPEVASVLLPAGLSDEAARAAVKRIQAADRPALIVDDIERRSALQADGIHLSDAARVRAMRAKLGDGLALGTECPLERHACMIAAEDGADYVAVRVTADNLEAAEELLSWWFEVMTTPIVALVDAAVDVKQLRAYADFLSPYTP